MIRLVNWLDRSWSFDLPVGAFPAVVERLHGTPARAEEMTVGLADRVLRARDGVRWSVKEHVGHLDDLHELDARRPEEFRGRAAMLTPADPANRRTDAANHVATPASEILARFRRHRTTLVRAMEDLTEEDIATMAVHPRLGRAIRLVDWAQVVADHDDHHLARARAVLQATGRDVGQTGCCAGIP